MIKNTKTIKIIGVSVILILVSLPSVFGIVSNPIKVDSVGGQVGFQAVNINETTIETVYDSSITGVIEPGMTYNVSYPAFVTGEDDEIIMGLEITVRITFEAAEPIELSIQEGS